MELGLIGLWISILSSIFILVHLPACDVHWSYKLGGLKKFLKKHHRSTLKLAVFFAFAHLLLLLLGIGFDIWI